MCGGPRAVEIWHADRVDHLVVALDADDRLVGQFHRCHRTDAQRGDEFFGCLWFAGTSSGMIVLLFLVQRHFRAVAKEGHD